MCDTQWTCPTDPANANPNGVAVSIIDQLNAQFILHGVKFVIQVGDLTENGNDADIAERATTAQALYGAGIGFFPMRGNHETYANPANDWGIPQFQTSFPQTRGGGRTFGAKNFSSPTGVSSDLDGMSYSFDFCNARFVILDDWVTPSKKVSAAGYNYGYSIADQQPWIDSRLDKSSRPDHAFVFSHQNLMGENHQDCLFNGYTNANPDMQNAFFTALQDNDVGYYISGHDHIHQRSIIASPDGTSFVEELICASNSSKFYTPKALTDVKWYGQKDREKSVSQERYTIGYYIFTVDGPRVTVDYYSDDHGNWASDAAYPGSGFDNQVTPEFNFVKKETWGYSLNGQQFVVAPDASYTEVQDTFETTDAKILDGTNDSTATDYNGRRFTKVVNTGWTDVDGRLWECFCCQMWQPDFDMASDILTIWGMADPWASASERIDDEQTAVFTLSMSYDTRLGRPEGLGYGGFGIATRDEDGAWVSAVDMNFGGTKKFVKGPWKPGYELGTYGVDPSTKTAWAVINYNGEFVVASGIEDPPGHQAGH
jgi:hypothetical protein